MGNLGSRSTVGKTRQETRLAVRVVEMEACLLYSLTGDSNAALRGAIAGPSFGILH